MDPKILIDAISSLASEIFIDGKQVKTTSEVYVRLSKHFNRGMSPNAIYLFIQHNKLARAMYGEWGVRGEEKKTGNENKQHPASDKSDTNHNRLKVRSKINKTIFKRSYF